MEAETTMYTVAILVGLLLVLLGWWDWRGDKIRQLESELSMERIRRADMEAIIRERCELREKFERECA